MQRVLRSDYSHLTRLKTLAETADFVDHLLNSVSPRKLLSWFMADSEMQIDSFSSALARIENNSGFSLRAELPYTRQCLRVALIFHFGLAFGLVSTRATNRIDLEYLYYAPFCNVFSSGDSLHQGLVPFVFRGDQVFVGRDLLKADLRGHSIWWSSLSEEEKTAEKQRSGPPPFEASTTYQIWKKFMKPNYRSNPSLKEKMSPDLERKLMEHISKLMEGAEPASPANHSLDDCNFVVRKHYVRFDGPCICGSEKTFGECCGRGTTAS